jgi:transposase
VKVTPRVLANLARHRMRSKLEALIQAMTGHFDDHHGFLAQIICQHIDVIDAMIAELHARIDAELVPYRRQVELLDSVAGISTRDAQVILAEIGVDMHQFPSAPHLASWAGVCPGNNKTGKARSGRTRPGDPWLKAALGVAAPAAIRKRLLPGGALSTHRCPPRRPARHRRRRTQSPASHLAHPVDRNALP